MQAQWLAVLLCVPGCLALWFPTPFIWLAQLDAAQAAKVQAYTRPEAFALPAALLPYAGRSLLEGIVRDLQAREYLHWRAFGGGGDEELEEEASLWLLLLSIVSRVPFAWSMTVTLCPLATSSKAGLAPTNDQRPVCSPPVTDSNRKGEPRARRRA